MLFPDKPRYGCVLTEVASALHWSGVKVRSCVKGKMDSQAAINLGAEIDGAAPEFTTSESAAGPHTPPEGFIFH